MSRKKQPSILLVDDDSGHRAMLRTLLEEWNYSVKEAEDGEQAISMFKGASFDLIFTDVRMPKKSGLEVLLEVKEQNPAMPVLIMTAFSTVEAAVEAIKAGAYDYLTKPLDFEKLEVILRNIFIYVGLIQENASLATSLATSLESANIIGQSSAMRKVMEVVRTVAPSEATVLITGESGTGKELIAKAIHTNSSRAKGPYIAFNCAAITDSLIESELFGHEKGAFTGADKRREGRFMLADKGTLFLDEIGEMPLLMQAKLLRVIQEREIQRVGGEQSLRVDVRLVAATNRDLIKEVAEGRFREDLYYRLNVVALSLPSLRERPEDVPLLARHFLEGFAAKNKKRVKGFTPGAMDKLIRYTWPGNVRELENVVERSVIMLSGEFVSEKELPPALAPNDAASCFTPGAIAVPPNPTLDDIEKAAIYEALRLHDGNKTEAAKQLGITRKTLHLRLVKWEGGGT
jgi:two-component system response regulator HydG